MAVEFCPLSPTHWVLSQSALSATFPDPLTTLAICLILPAMVRVSPRVCKYIGYTVAPPHLASRAIIPNLLALIIHYRA